MILNFRARLHPDPAYFVINQENRIFFKPAAKSAMSLERGQQDHVSLSQYHGLPYCIKSVSTSDTPLRAARFSLTNFLASSSDIFAS